MRKQWLAIYVISFMISISIQLSARNTPAAEPAAALEDRKLDMDVPLLREGYQIINREAKLVRHPGDGRWFLLFRQPENDADTAEVTSEQTPDPPAGKNNAAGTRTASAAYNWPIEVLPGKWLAKMAQLSAPEVDLSITYQIWGEITTYDKRNYILPQQVKTRSLFQRESERDDSGRSPQKRSTILDRLYGSKQEAGRPAGDNDQANQITLSDEVRNMLTSIPRSHVLEAEEDLVQSMEDAVRIIGNQPTGNGDDKKKGFWREGYYIKDRLGRLVFDYNDNTYKFILESHSEELAEPPLIVHPNQLLEVIEQMVGKSGRLQFRVSGMVTKYQNRYYLLMRKVMMVYDRGNLGNYTASD